ANIGVIARRAEFTSALRRELTAARVKDYFSHLVKGEVERFEVPGIGGFNFLMHRALDGGGMASLRNDPLGKGMAQMLLDIEIDVPADLLYCTHRRAGAVVLLTVELWFHSGCGDGGPARLCRRSWR